MIAGLSKIIILTINCADLLNTYMDIYIVRLIIMTREPSCALSLASSLNFAGRQTALYVLLLGSL